MLCTNEEIANVLGCHVDTIYDKLKDKRSEFSKAYQRGKAEGKLSLRRMQLKSAMNGNVPMLIWLGKNLLGQRDSVSTDHTSNIVDVAALKNTVPRRVKST